MPELMTGRMDVSTAPEAVKRLLRWLDKSGFKAVVAESPNQEAFGNQHGIWEKDVLRIGVTRDRDEWSLGIRSTDPDYWAHPDEWKALLEGERLEETLSSLDRQVEFIMSRLEEIHVAARDSSQIEQVREIGARWAAEHLGFFPP